MTLRVVAVYPDLLGTYGDTGNAEILAQRARWRGIEVELILAASSSPLPMADLYCLGGGEDGPQVLAAERLRHDATLARATEGGAVVFAVCAGFQIIGRSFPDATGAPREGLGLLDVSTTKGQGRRSVGELVAEVANSESGGLGLPLLTGFENHGGVTVLGPMAAPLGRVLSGVGNGAGGDSEGAYRDNVLGTYLHGPVLARNPALADVLLARAMGVESLISLDDSRELRLREERLAQARRAMKLRHFSCRRR
jgi:CobQ-like glutamine amidotransferase family enzyme